MVEIELLIQRSDQFRSNKIIKGFFLVYLGFTFFVVWVNVFLVKEVKPSRLYFEWVEGGKNNFLKPKFKKLIKYYILLFCFINSEGATAPQGHQIAPSLVLALWERSNFCRQIWYGKLLIESDAINFLCYLFIFDQYASMVNRC